MNLKLKLRGKNQENRKRETRKTKNSLNFVISVICSISLYFPLPDLAESAILYQKFFITKSWNNYDSKYNK